MEITYCQWMASGMERKEEGRLARIDFITGRASTAVPIRDQSLGMSSSSGKRHLRLRQGRSLRELYSLSTVVSERQIG
jgi:hypothetical protein